MKKSISILIILIVAFSALGCGLFGRESEKVKPHLIEYSERELNPVRHINSAPFREFETGASDSTEYQLAELFAIVYGGSRPEFSDAIHAEVKETYYAALEILDRYIKNGFSEFERVHAIHDWLTSQVLYDEELYARYSAGENIDENHSAFQLTGALLDKSAVCDGFVKAFRFLCAIEGIDTQSIRGEYNYGDRLVNHIWAKVCIDGKWYNIDPTMDSITFYPTKGDPITVVHHGYFLLSDSALSGFGNHIPSDSGFEANGSYDFYSDAKSANDENIPMQVDSAEELNAVFRQIKNGKRKIGQVELKLNMGLTDVLAVRPEAYSDEIKAAYDIVKNKDFSYIPKRNEYTPFAKYPGGVFVFLIYK